MSKKKILVHVGYAINSIGGNVLCKQLRYLKNKYEATHDIVLVLSNVKTLKGVETVERLSGIKFSSVIRSYDFWKEVFPKGIYKYDSWLKFYHNENWFDNLQDVESIYMFGGLINSQLLREGDALNRAVIGGARFLKFVSASTYISTVFQLLKLSNERGIELNEIVYDPQEASLDTITDEGMKARNHKLWFCYDIPRIKAKRLDYMQNTGEHIFDVADKHIDFCFGSTFVSKYRYDCYERILPILDFFRDKHTSRIFIYHNKLDIDTRVNHGEYQGYIHFSRFTLIIPSYDIRTFSMIRFYEALSRNCLPLILDECYVADFAASFDISPEVLSEITVSANINSFNMDETRRLEIISYLKKQLKITN